MTPRARMKKFFAREPVDRIPNGLGGCETAGLHNLAYDKLKRILGVTDRKNRLCTFMNNAIFEPSVLDAMEGDIILLASRMCPSRFWGPGADAQWKDLHIWDTTLQVANEWDFRKDPDGAWWWGGSKCPPGGFYFDSPAPSEVARVFDAAEPPSPDDFNPGHEMGEEWLRRLEEDARWLWENTDFCIACGETIHDLQLRPGGTQAWWMRMVREPEACHAFLSKAVDAGLAHLKQLDQAVGSYCDLLMIADDIGDVRGVTIGPELWREIYKPHYKRLFTEWHNITKMKVALHCCGSTADILEDLIECGVDVYNPVQISAGGMDPGVLKQRFGGRIIFYGGVFDSVLLPPPTPADAVYEAVKKNIETFSRGGGYLFAGVHNLPGDLPEAHLRAMLAAYTDCRDNPELTDRPEDLVERYRREQEP